MPAARPALYPYGRNTSRPGRRAHGGARWSGPARVLPLDHWSKPETLAVDLTVVVAEGPEVDRVVTDHLLRLDQPHLLVRSLGDAAWVGPLVLPGRTPCLRCTDSPHSMPTRGGPRCWPSSGGCGCHCPPC